MHLKILSWNVWGLNDSTKRLVVKASLRRWKPHVICVQETKMEKVDKKVVDSAWVDWNHLGAVGELGSVCDVGSRVFLSWGLLRALCLFKGVEDDFTWVFSGVYGPCSMCSYDFVGRAKISETEMEISLVHTGGF